MTEQTDGAARTGAPEGAAHGAVHGPEAASGPGPTAQLSDRQAAANRWITGATVGGILLVLILVGIGHGQPIQQTFGQSNTIGGIVSSLPDPGAPLVAGSPGGPGGPGGGSGSEAVGGVGVDGGGSGVAGAGGAVEPGGSGSPAPGGARAVSSAPSAASRAPSPGTGDALADAQTGTCYNDSGSGTVADLTPVACGPGAFQVVQVFDHTTSTGACDGVAAWDEAVSSAADDLVACLAYQSTSGTAFHAQPGQCVSGPDGPGAWSTGPCQAGDFTVLAVFRGDLDAGQCASWPHYDEYWTAPVPGHDGLGVLLCLAMNYPDALGFANVGECLAMTGSGAAAVFTATPGCQGADVYVTARTATYDDPGYCGRDGSQWWEPSGFPALGYTVCWDWTTP